MAHTAASSYGPDRERQLGHLASSVGHHVINAFSAVVSNAEILKLSSPSDIDAELAATVDVIVNVSVNASGVARRLIDFTRPSTCPAERPVDLSSIIREVVSQLTEAFPSVNWSVDCKALTPMEGDLDQLRPMFSYLLLNSIEALKPSGGRIVLRGLVEESGWTSLLIEDDGFGMDALVQEQALEPFFSTKPGRLGIGLCLANSIWRRHGGTLAIRSQPGRGTTLRLTYGQRRGLR